MGSGAGTVTEPIMRKSVGTEAAQLKELSLGSSTNPRADLLAHRDAAYLLALRMVNNRSDAEDVVQEAYLKAVRIEIPDLDDSKMRAWFLRLVANVVRDHWKADRRRERHERRAAVERREDTTSASDDVAENKELRQRVDQALAGLEEKTRLSVSLHYEHGLSYREAGEILDVPEGTLRVYAQRGLQEIRTILSGRGHTVTPSVVTGLLSGGALVETPAALKTAVDAIVAGASATAKGAVISGATTGASAWLGTKALAGFAFLAAGLATVVSMPSAPEAQPEAPAIAAPAEPEITGDPKEDKETSTAKPIASLEEILARKIDVTYRREYLDEVLEDLRLRVFLRSAQPETIDETFMFTLERKDVTVKEVLAEMAKAGGLEQQIKGDTVVFWKKVTDQELDAAKKGLTDEDAAVRADAIGRLARLGDPRIYPLLFAGLADKSKDVAGWAAYGLLRHLDTLGYGEGVDKAYASIVAWRLDPPKPLRVSDLANLIGATRHAEAVKALLPFYSNEDRRIREGAAEALGYTRSTEAVTPLLDLLKGKYRQDDGRRRRGGRRAEYSVARSLVKIGGSKTVDMILQELKTAKKEASHTRYLIAALGAMGDGRAAETLVSYLKSEPKPEGERMTPEELRAAFQRGDPKAIEQVRKSRERYYAGIKRVEAAISLARLGDKRGETQLSKEVKAIDSYWMKQHAVTGLGRLRTERAEKQLLELSTAESGKSSVISALNANGYRSADVLACLKREAHREFKKKEEPKEEGEEKDRRRGRMSREDYWRAAARNNAVSGLGSIRDATSFDELSSFLKHEDPMVLRYAISGFSKLRDDRCVEVVMPFFEHKDRYVRDAAADYFREAWDQRAEKPLVKLLEDPEDLVKAAAAEALLAHAFNKAALDTLVKAAKEGSKWAQRYVSRALGKALRQAPFAERDRILEAIEVSRSRRARWGGTRGGRGREERKPVKPPKPPEDEDF